MQAEETPATGQPSPPNVMAAADTEMNQPPEPWLLPHVRFCFASVLTVHLLLKANLVTQIIMMLLGTMPVA